jgi:hypothetical protein
MSEQIPGSYTPSDLRAGAADDAAAMSTPQTLTGIFFEPGRTFEALRARPRFLAAGLITVALLIIFQTLFIQRLGGFESFMRAQIEASPRTAEMPADQRERIIEMQTKPVFKAIAYVSPLIIAAIIIAAGSAIYLLGVMAMGKSIRYKQALAVWTYSGLPPSLLIMLANLILLYVRSPDDIDIARSSRGLVHANLGILVDATAHPVLATLLGSCDLFRFYGLFLAALGLRKMTRLSSGAAWAIVLLLWLLSVLAFSAISALTGSPMA